ncbi:MAG: hypothetical protein ACI8P0_003320 [Planctomycetaceae bacterium]|jgi:hypothetical protein
MMRTACMVLIAVVGFSFQVSAEDTRLPGTAPLEWSEAELPDRLMDGAHKFVERKIADVAKTRQQFWPANDVSADAWNKATDENREELRTITGAVDKRLPPQIDFFGCESHQVIHKTRVL